MSDVAEIIEVPVEGPAEDSQPEETVEDTTTEEEASVVVDTEDVEEEPSEEKPEEEEPKEEDVPFTERPGVKKRLAEMEEKYGSKATYWDTIAELSKEDPEFRIMILEKLEASGKLPKGTVEQEKAKTSSLQKEEDYIKNLPEQVQADLLAARKIREEAETLQREQAEKAEAFFKSFEEARPEIGASPNPQRTRNLIFNLANELVDRDDMNFEEAMDAAYKTILKPNENEEVKSAISKQMQNPGAVSGGTAAQGKKLRKLTQAEKRGAELMGVSVEEYIKYRDSSDEELFENI